MKAKQRAKIEGRLAEVEMENCRLKNEIEELRIDNDKYKKDIEYLNDIIYKNSNYIIRLEGKIHDLGGTV